MDLVTRENDDNKNFNGNSDQDHEIFYDFMDDQDNITKKENGIIATGDQSNHISMNYLEKIENERRDESEGMGNNMPMGKNMNRGNGSSEGGIEHQLLKTMPQEKSLNSLLEIGEGNNDSSSDDDASSIAGSLNSMMTFLSTLTLNNQHSIKPVRVKGRKKSKIEFQNLFLIQELTVSNPSCIYTIKFSPDGSLLAAGYSDGRIFIWRLLAEEIIKKRMGEREEMTIKEKGKGENNQSFLSNSSAFRHSASSISQFEANNANCMISEHELFRMAPIFNAEPIQILTEHEEAVIDLSWSRNNFLLSASTDSTVRLWHWNKSESLMTFKHGDWVTSVAFHPKDDRLFISGCLDKRLRLWSMESKQVQAWNEISLPITAVGFSRTGKFAMAGNVGGVCYLFLTCSFKYHTQIYVRSRRGENAVGKKITGIIPKTIGNDEILITTNDSRIRSYTLLDKSMTFKYKGGLINKSSQIQANYSQDGEFIISGSEDGKVCIWNTEGKYQKKSIFGSFTSSNRNKISSMEYFYTTSSNDISCTAAIMAPISIKHKLQLGGMRPILSPPSSLNDTNEGEMGKKESSFSSSMTDGMVIITADSKGKIKIFENNSKLENWLNVMKNKEK